MDAFELVLEKIKRSPVDQWSEIQPVHPKNQSSEYSLNVYFPKAESWLTGKDPDAEKDWRLKEKGAEEDEIIK